ncbi:MAG: SDR family oxidoreductase [Actinomycetota bacterium]|nr:SDR family oxidoreductase [Actinomycetota bacterium]
MTGGSTGRAVVTGGAGFLGSHLCEALLARGYEVVCVDNLSTSDGTNVSHLLGKEGFSLVRADITERLTIDGPVDVVAHLASPASPADYFRLPLQTLDAGSRGTEACLRLAAEQGARYLLASTSEVYGDPIVHPQPETYWGNVNPIGPRSVYDESKRFAEALSMAWARERGVDVVIVRIFNTYGPRLRAGDGRVVSNFIVQALTGRPLTIYGDGRQTRSLCYQSDLISGLVAALDARGVTGPVNLGNPTELTVLELASQVLEATGSSSEVVQLEALQDDPARRQPDITRAGELLGWAPEVTLTDGLLRTISWFAKRLDLK